MDLNDPRLMEALDAENERDPFMAPVPQWDGRMPPEHNTFEGWRQRRIAAGFCPRSYCLGPLVDDCCTLCGWRLADEKPIDEDQRPVPWYGPEDD